jgi:hypothetical protein
LWQFWVGLHCTLLRLPHHLPPSKTLPNPLKAIIRGFIIVFHICIWSPLTIFPHLHLLCSPSRKYPLHTQPPILQPCLSLSVPKSMFKGVSWRIPTVSTLYSGQFNSSCDFHRSPVRQVMLFIDPLLASWIQYTMRLRATEVRWLALDIWLVCSRVQLFIFFTTLERLTKHRGAVVIFTKRGCFSSVSSAPLSPL